MIRVLIVIVVLFKFCTLQIASVTNKT